MNRLWGAVCDLKACGQCWLILLCVAVTTAAHAKPQRHQVLRSFEHQERSPRTKPSSPHRSTQVSSGAPFEPTSYAVPLGLSYLIPLGVLVGAGAQTNTSKGTGAFAAAGLLGMFVLPPVVHLGYRNPDAALRSLLISVLSVPAGAVSGALVANAYGCADLCLGGAALGAMGGYLAWGTIDTIFFAHTVPKFSSQSLAPTLTPILGGLSLGVSGTF